MGLSDYFYDDDDEDEDKPKNYSFKDKLDLNREAREPWGELFTKKLGFKKYTNMEDNIPWQHAGLGDAIIYDHHDNRFYVELKTASDFNYYKYFKRDNTIYIEEMANVELNKKGSALSECTVPIWAYGFLVNGEIEPHFIYDTKKLQNWYAQNYTKCEKSRDITTDHKYTGRGRKVDVDDLKGCNYVF